MIHVAPMPDNPPFRNGFTAFQVELSARDIVLGWGGDVRDVLTGREARWRVCPAVGDGAKNIVSDAVSLKSFPVISADVRWLD